MLLFKSRLLPSLQHLEKKGKQTPSPGEGPGEASRRTCTPGHAGLDNEDDSQDPKQNPHCDGHATGDGLQEVRGNGIFGDWREETEWEWGGG